MKKNSVFIILVFIGCLMFLVPGCIDSSKSDEVAAKKTEQMMQEADKECGMPNIVNWQEKKTAKLIIEQCDRADLICYAYKENLHGQFIFIGRCVGYGLPYSVQYTNPQRKVYGANGGNISLPQPDPSGLFKPEGLPATW